MLYAIVYKHAVHAWFWFEYSMLIRMFLSRDVSITWCMLWSGSLIWLRDQHDDNKHAGVPRKPASTVSETRVDCYPNISAGSDTYTYVQSALFSYDSFAWNFPK